MLSLNPWNILWTVINLLVLYAIFKKFLFQPVLNVIHAREEMIRQSFEDAQKNQDQALMLKTEYQNKIQTAQTEADQIITEARVRAEEEYEKKLDVSRSEAQKILEKAKTDIVEEQEKARQEVQSEIARLAVLAARKIMKSGDIHDAGRSK